MKLIAQLQLNTTPEQKSLLLNTIERANQACNAISGVAWQERVFFRNPLHKLVYYDIRQRFGLSAQMTCRCIAKVVDAYKKDRKTKRTFQNHGSIAYDARILSFAMNKKTLSIWTLQGRQQLPFVCGPRQWELLQHQKGESDLSYRNASFFLLSTCELEEEKAYKPTGIMGVDMGLAQLASDSDGNHYGEHVRAIRKKRNKTRKSLQKKGSKSARRRLKKRSRKESRFRNDVNHTIAKRLVKSAKRTNRAIAFEALKGIRSRVRVDRTLRGELHSWAFYDLQQKIRYKARCCGVPVVEVNPAYTSQTCSFCGHCEKANRKSQSQFSCKACGVQLHADQNAARNIGLRGAESLALMASGGSSTDDVLGTPSSVPLGTSS